MKERQSISKTIYKKYTDIKDSLNTYCEITINESYSKSSLEPYSTLRISQWDKSPMNKKDLYISLTEEEIVYIRDFLSYILKDQGERKNEIN